MSDQVNHQKSILPLLIVATVFMVAVSIILWHMKHTQIVQHMLIWKAYEVIPMAWIFGPADDLKQRLVIYFNHASVMNFGEVYWLGWQIGAFWVFIPFGLAIWWARKALRHPVVHAYRVHTIQSLLEAQSRSFSSVVPVLKRDLTNDTSPEWKSSVHPEEWVAEYGLIVNDALDVPLVRERLVEQLGKRVKSYGEFKPEERALFAVFGLRVFFKDKKGADALADALNYSAKNNESKANLSLAGEAFERCASAPAAKQWIRKHPYPRTLLMALLIESRQMGVLPSANFIWLKPHDRALWYPLNTAGRKAPFMESAGVFNQMQAEEVAWDAGCVLTEPHVENAIAGLKKYLEDTGVLDVEGSKPF